jgi:hypothetical protein
MSPDSTCHPQHAQLVIDDQPALPRIPTSSGWRLGDESLECGRLVQHRVRASNTWKPATLGRDIVADAGLPPAIEGGHPVQPICLTPRRSEEKGSLLVFQTAWPMRAATCSLVARRSSPSSSPPSPPRNCPSVCCTSTGRVASGSRRCCGSSSPAPRRSGSRPSRCPPYGALAGVLRQRFAAGTGSGDILVHLPGV